MDARPSGATAKGRTRVFGASEVTLAALLVLGFALRALSPLLLPNIAFPDEFFQTVEQAYRLLTGHGFVPWEYYYGIRSWIFPGAIAGIMKLAWWIDLSTAQTLVAIRLTMAVLSLPIIVCAFFWGRRTGIQGAELLAGGLVAIWPDLVYFSSHTLTEVAATVALIPGVFLADLETNRAAGRRRVMAAGFLLALASVLRVQFAPAALLAWAWMMWPACIDKAERARIAPAILGGLLPLLLAAVVDWMSWGRPLQSLWLNVIVNWNYGAASSFGVGPWYHYFAKFVILWGGAVPFVIAAAIIGTPRNYLPAAVAAVLILVHVLIPHKEFRFILPAIPLILTLAGIGTARLFATAIAGAQTQDRRLREWIKPIMIGCACLLWGAAAGGLFIGREYLDLFRRQSGVIAASLDIARTPNLCGIAIRGIKWYELAGEFALGHTVLVFYPSTEAEFASRSPGFNAVLYAKAKPPPGEGWRTLSCHPIDARLPDKLAHGAPHPEVCIAVREGGCTKEPPLIPPLLLPISLLGKPFPWLTQPLPDQVEAFPTLEAVSDQKGRYGLAASSLR